MFPAGCDFAASLAAAPPLMPAAVDGQNNCQSLRLAIDCRPDDFAVSHPQQSDRHFRMPVATLFVDMLRLPVKPTKGASRG